MLIWKSEFLTRKLQNWYTILNVNLYSENVNKIYNFISGTWGDYAEMTRATAHHVEVIAENLPDARPLQPDTSHVVVWDFHYLLKAEHPRMNRVGEFIQGDVTQSLHKLHCQYNNNSYSLPTGLHCD